jgi:AraC-like DNA-binding protein
MPASGLGRRLFESALERYVDWMLIQPAAFGRLCRARDRLHQLDDAPSIRSLAAQLGLSQFQFIRQFHALFGETPHQLRIDARIDRAKRLLERDGGSVTEVCMGLGFSSLGSFSSSFRRRVGENPSAYRRQARRLWQVRAALGVAPPLGCFGLLAYLPRETFCNFGEA